MGGLLIAAALGFASPLLQVHNDVQGQAQQSGIYGRFGDTYTMQNGLNLTVYGTHYQLEPYYGYNGIYAATDQKLIVLDFGLKNATPQEVSFGDGSSYFTLLDSSGNKYPPKDISIQSHKAETFFLNLKPGQGIGQPELKDPLRIVFSVPDEAKITKLFINQGRKGRQEEVLRYLIAGTDKTADVKNVMKPLPVEVRDPSDPSGAVALAQGKGTIGVFHPTSAFMVRVDSVAAAPGEKMEGNEPEDGKVYWVVKLTLHNASPVHMTLFDMASEDIGLIDGDGDKYKVVGYRKGSSDAEVDQSREMAYGVDYSYRMFILAPKDAKMKALVLKSDRGRYWKYDLP